MLKYALLGILIYNPKTGYDLKQFMDVSTTYFWHAKLSQIYTTLKLLEEEGLVNSQIETREERPDRKVYTITPAGKVALQAWLATPMMEIEPRKETLLLKLFFSAKLEKETLLMQLRLQRQLHEQVLATYKHETVAVIQEAAAQFPSLQKDALLWEATRRFGELYEAMYLDWLDQTIEIVIANL